MAIAQFKESNFQLKHILSRDYVKNGSKTKINNNSRASLENQIGEEDASLFDINGDMSIDIADAESAYEESFCSDISEESELTDRTRRSSLNEIPACKLSKSKSNKNEDSLELSKKFVSTSNICDNTDLTLEDRVKCLSLSEVRSSRNLQIRPNNRKNMSFTNDEIMKIERDNEILLRKIMAQQKPQKVKIQPVQTRISSSAINRKKLQKKIEEDNMMLLRRLQQAKSCVHNTNKVLGYRATHL